MPLRTGLPLSRLSTTDLHREVLKRSIVASIGQSTLWRCLSEDAIKPWTHRSWVFPRDPRFAEKAGPTLDLYEGHWQGQALGPDDFVLQIEIYFSVVQRKVLTPNDFRTLDEVRDRLTGFQRYYQEIARPFQWKFTRTHLSRLLERLTRHEAKLVAAA